MPATKTVAVMMDDLFGGPARRVGTASPEPAPATPKAPRRKVHAEQREGHARVLAHAETIDQRCAFEVYRQGTRGATRPEIAVATGIAINSVCGAVDRLMKIDQLIEPVTGWDATGKPNHFRRERCKVLVHTTHQNAVDWLAPGHPVRTSAA